MAEEGASKFRQVVDECSTSLYLGLYWAFQKADGSNKYASLPQIFIGKELTEHSRVSDFHVFLEKSGRNISFKLLTKKIFSRSLSSDKD